MGAVYEGLHELNGARHAIKTLPPGAARDPELALRFQREIEALAKLDHPRVVRIHAAELSGGRPYLAQDLLAGGSLGERLRAGPLPLDEALDVTAALADGLAHAHARGVLHRDLKPENVLFDEEGRACLCDFGLALLAGPERLTRTGDILGTPSYMAPEQALDAKACDARSDVYGLGGLLYAMLSGRPPIAPRATLAQTLEAVIHEAPAPLRQDRPELPAAIEALCLRALAKRPEGRFPDANALGAALRAARQGAAPRRGAARLGMWGLAAALVALAGAVAVLVPAGPATETPSAVDPDSAATAPGPREESLPAWLPAAAQALADRDGAALRSAVPAGARPRDPEGRRLAAWAALLRGGPGGAELQLSRRALVAAGALVRETAEVHARLDAWLAVRRDSAVPSLARRSTAWTSASPIFVRQRELLERAERTLPLFADALARELLGGGVQELSARLVFEFGDESLPPQGVDAFFARARALAGSPRGLRALDAAEACLLFKLDDAALRASRLDRARRALAAPGPGPWTEAVQALLTTAALQELTDADPGATGPWPPAPAEATLPLLTLKVYKRQAQFVLGRGRAALVHLLDAGETAAAARLWTVLLGHNRALLWQLRQITLKPEARRDEAFGLASLHLFALNARGAREALAPLASRSLSPEDALAREHLADEAVLLEGESEAMRAAVARCTRKIEREGQGGPEVLCLRGALRAALGEANERDLMRASVLGRFAPPLLSWRDTRHTHQELTGEGIRRALRDALLRSGQLSPAETDPDW